MKRNWWLFASAGGLLLSVLTLFLPIIQYDSSSNEHYSYNLISFITDPDAFLRQTLFEYTGSFLHSASNRQIIFLVLCISLVGVVALVFSTVGIVTLSKQKPNVGPFVLALLGLVGTAIPALALLIMFVLSNSFFKGNLSIGAYAIVTPAAMILAMLAVTYKRKLTLEELRAQEASIKYWSDPGNPL